MEQYKQLVPQIIAKVLAGLPEFVEKYKTKPENICVEFETLHNGKAVKLYVEKAASFPHLLVSIRTDYYLKKMRDEGIGGENQVFAFEVKGNRLYLFPLLTIKQQELGIPIPEWGLHFR